MCVRPYARPPRKNGPEAPTRQECRTSGFWPRKHHHALDARREPTAPLLRPLSLQPVTAHCWIMKTTSPNRMRHLRTCLGLCCCHVRRSCPAFGPTAEAPPLRYACVRGPGVVCGAIGGAIGLCCDGCTTNVAPAKAVSGQEVARCTCQNRLWTTPSQPPQLPTFAVWRRGRRGGPAHRPLCFGFYAFSAAIGPCRSRLPPRGPRMPHAAAATHRHTPA